MRLVSLVANRLGGLRFESIPAWLTAPAGTHGVSPSLRDLNTNLRTVFHSYQAPPATITATFSGGETIAIYIGPDEQVFAVVRDPSGRVITSKSQAYQLNFPRVAIQPQVGPLAVNEKRLDPKTVRAGMDSPLAPLHFRNQLFLVGSEAFERFKEKAETTWPGLQIQALTSTVVGTDEILSLLVRDGGYVGEVAAMGHGLQMWLQVIWFLTRNEASPTVILDEPDVYMHADLQHKLIRLLQGTHQQVIVATHSIEIMAQVEPSEVLVVDAAQKESKWMTSVRGVQKVIDNIGGVHNIQLSRLARSRRCLFLEGDDDLDLLRLLNNSLFPTSDPLDVVPRLIVGGWSGWQRVVGTAQFLRNGAGDVIASYSIFDSDCHVPSEILGRYEEAERINVRLHIWRRKEIENYLLVPTAIQRVIERRIKVNPPGPDGTQVARAIDRMAGEAVDEARDDYSTYYATVQRVQAGRASRWARQYAAKRLAEPDGLLGVVSGKRLLKDVSAWAESHWGVTFGSAAIAREMSVSEIPDEIYTVLSCIGEERPFPEHDAQVWKDRAEY